jgi:hypothetical protein
LIWDVVVVVGVFLALLLLDIDIPDLGVATDAGDEESTVLPLC